MPPEAAEQIAAGARAEALDLDRVAAGTRSTSHSTLGLIRELQRVLPESAREHVYVGATVQDVSDTWFGLLMRDVGAIVRRDLLALEATVLGLAELHRDTVMVGRTHGQPGAPITFGFKAASWADELRRHLDRLREGRPRWAVGQLAGAVGALAFHEAELDPLALRRDFCAELGLGDPGASWLTSRDRVAEFGHVLALVCGTLARIGTEVYELARPEIGELAEPTTATAVGSITMPHKRNPEVGEHLDTLARLARSSAGVLLEGTVVSHERDGRGWKAEWVALPEVCLLTGTALGLARTLLGGSRGPRRRDGRQPRTLRRPAHLRARARGAGRAPRQARRPGPAPGRARRRRRRRRRGRGARGRVGRGGARVDGARPGRHRGPDGRRGGGAGPRGSGGGGRVTWLPRLPPRLALGTLPTPLVEAPRLRAELGCGPLRIKRDDLAGFGIAGNKTRPLEYLLGDALAHGVDVLVTGGGPDSNFVAAAAMAARVAGHRLRAGGVGRRRPTAPHAEPGAGGGRRRASRAAG